MNVIEQLRDAVERGSRGELGRIAAESGVPFKTLNKIYYGSTANPSYKNVLLLQAYFSRPSQPRAVETRAA